MAKGVITKDGEEVIVREDTAKAFRLVRWGGRTIAIGLTLIAILLIIILLKRLSN